MNYEKYLDKQTNETQVVNHAKITLSEYKKKSAEVDKLLKAITKKLDIHQRRFISGREPDMTYITDLEKIAQDLKTIDASIRY